MKGLNDLERAVMHMLLSGEHPALATLREQADRSRLREREATGVGFYCHFDVPEDAPVVEHATDFEIGDVNGQIQGLVHGAGFVLFIRGGRIDFLEGFSYDEPWPDHIGEFVLSYQGGSRDLPVAEG